MSSLQPLESNRTMELSDTAILNVRGKQLEQLLRDSSLECGLGLTALGLALLALVTLGLKSVLEQLSGHGTSGKY